MNKKLLIPLWGIILVLNMNAQVADHVVIAEIYGGGGNSGATLLNDYVVLYNPTASAVDISTWSLQVSRKDSSNWEVQNLIGSIQAGSYYLILFGSAGNNGDTVLTGPNLVSDVRLVQTDGKIALVSNQTPLTGINPLPNAAIIDFVGYGTSADAYEGSGPTASINNSSSVRRKDNSGNNTYNTNGNGYDSNDNSNDFYVESTLLSNPPANQSALTNHVVIAEIYTTGGNTGAIYTNDFVVLYNPTGSSVDLSSWSIQRENLNGTEAWYSTNLTGSIDADSYYLIEGRVGATGDSLPFTPDVSDQNFNLNQFTGKVALVSNQVIITGSGDPDVIDFVGYGGANEFEGLDVAPAPSSTQSIRRRDNSGLFEYISNGHGWDVDDNKTDFYLQNNPSPPLPVELSSFSASVEEYGIRLNWRTETEINNYGFEIQKKNGDNDWLVIGFVEGSGTTFSPRNYSFTDEDITSGIYSYRLKQIDTDGRFEYSAVIQIDLDSPTGYELSQNYPNPFNPVTTIRYSLPEESEVKLTIYNILGQQVTIVVDELKDAGIHTVNFDAEGLNSGVYFYKLEAGEYTQIRKMVLMR